MRLIPPLRPQAAPLLQGLHPGRPDRLLPDHPAEDWTPVTAAARDDPTNRCALHPRSICEPGTPRTGWTQRTAPVSGRAPRSLPTPQLPGTPTPQQRGRHGGCCHGASGGAHPQPHHTDRVSTAPQPLIPKHCFAQAHLSSRE